MNHNEIQAKYNEICDLIINKEISESIQQLKLFANQTKKEYHQIQIESLKETYSNILKHSFSNIT